MKDVADNTSSPGSSVEATLLDYFSAPGKYQLMLREPSLLFSSIRHVLQLAASRTSAQGGDADQLRQAAAFFLRAALLYPGADHYAVLGYTPGADAPDLKERYRLMMRLIHPDFATEEWPADAAMRVNRAYEALSSPVLRREYDEQLAANRAPKPAPAMHPGYAVRAMPKPVRSARPARLSPKVGLALGLGLAGIAIMLLLPRQEADHLVQVTASASLPAERAGRQAPPELAREPAPAPASAAAPVDPAADTLVADATHAVTAASEAPVTQELVATMPPLAASHSLNMAPPAPQAPAALPRPQAITRVPPAASPKPVPPPSDASPLAWARSALAKGASALSARPAMPPAAPAPARPPAPEPAPVVAVVAPMPAPVAVPEPTPVLAPPPAAPRAAAEPAAPSDTGHVSAAALVVTAAPAVAKLTTTLTLRAAPTLADAQPLITQLLQVLETGSSEQVLRLLEPGARQAAGAQQLSRRYNDLVHGARPVRLSEAQFEGEAHDGVLLVTGHLRLHAGEPTIGSRGQPLLLKAEFASRNGKVTLTGLGGASE